MAMTVHIDTYLKVYEINDIKKKLNDHKKQGEWTWAERFRNIQDPELAKYLTLKIYMVHRKHSV